jgi:hypothetical protein
MLVIIFLLSGSKEDKMIRVKRLIDQITDSNYLSRVADIKDVDNQPNVKESAKLYNKRVHEIGE